MVLVFGNYTCRPFRGQGGNLEKLYARYKDRATFLAIYIREAHPTDGWRMEVNDVLGVSIPQPRSYAERARVAQVCSTSLGLGFPMLVDTLDDAVNKTYCGIPSRLYLIDSERKIAYKSGRGPFGFKPAELEQSLVMLLQQETTGTSSTAKQRSPAAASPALRKRAAAAYRQGGETEPRYLHWLSNCSSTASSFCTTNGVLPWHTSSCPKARPASSGP